MSDTEPSEGLHLSLHRAPTDLLAGAHRRRTARRRRRVAVGVTLGMAAAFAVGLGVGRLGQPTASPAAPVAVVQPASDPAVHPERVPVRLVLFEPDATTVSVAASWNDWNPDAVPLTRSPDGHFHATVDLPRGRHEYMFVIDGQEWVCDPAAPLTSDDGFGRRNAVLEI